MLELRGVSASYGHGDVLHDVSLTLEQGTFTALVGANGAGKSTMMRVLSGLMQPSSGSVHFEGRSLAGLRAERVMGLGLSLVPEGRKVFGPLTVAENLEMGAFRALMRRDGGWYRDRLGFVLSLFPKLEERLQQTAATLSGGEQQMLAIGRALMSGPRLLLLDEPSMGLAPIVVKQIFDTIDRLRAEGLTLFVCEQNTDVTLRHAQTGHVLDSGRVVLSLPAAQLREDARVKEAYLGT